MSESKASRKDQRDFEHMMKAKISELQKELERGLGHRGICSNCGEEEIYANYGYDVPKLCSKCWNEGRIAEARKKFVHLIGLKVEDVIICSDIYPFQGLKLEGGYLIEVETDYEGDAHLEVTKS
jgi:hypothetical protein